MNQSTQSSNQDQTAPISSQEYLKRLRQKRLNRKGFAEQTTQTNTEPIKPKNSSQTQANQPNPTPNERMMDDNDKDENDRFPGIPKPRPKRTLMSWRAPSRPFKKRDSHYYLTIVALVFLISLILFFAGQFLTIAVVIAIGFLAYVLSSVPPQEITNEINTWGIKIGDTLYYWEEMGRFWFEDKYDQEMLQVEIIRFPGRISLLFEAGRKNDLEELLSEVLIQEKPADTFYDKAADWLKKKIPLDISS